MVKIPNFGQNCPIRHTSKVRIRARLAENCVLELCESIRCFVGRENTISDTGAQNEMEITIDQLTTQVYQT